jgi:superfamily II DNA or RNA helicase
MLAEHQQVALERLRTLLARYGGALLADAPGTGKTRVAAALAREYASAGHAIEIVVPATLVAQWREALDLFDVDAIILTHDRLATVAWMPRHEPRLLIVDEAHAFRNAATRRYDALARRSIGAKVLLVTATPLCNRAAELHALLDLIVCDDALASLGIPSLHAVFEQKDYRAVGEAVDQLAVRRGRDVVPSELRFGVLRKHRVEYPVAPDVAAVRAAVDALRFPLLPSASLLRRLLLFRFQSSEAALHESIGRQVRFYQRALDALQNGRSLTRRDYSRIFGRERPDVAQQVLFWDAFVDAPAVADANELVAEIDRLLLLQRLTTTGTSVKVALLREVVTRAEGPVLVYTAAVATARSLVRELRGIAPVAIATAAEGALAGRAIAAFANGRVDVLIATDLASEGLNLQRAAVVIHYDLPWNPVRLDQRNGRAHRIGQRRASVEAYYFVPVPDLCGVHAIALRKTRLRARLEAPPSPAVVATPTMRPRIGRDDPEMRLATVAARAGFDAAGFAARPRRAGLRRLMAELAGEQLSEAKLNYLALLAAAEP